MTTSHDLESQIVSRALKDPQFRAQLLTDPNAAIASATGVQILEGMQVRVIEQEPNTVYLVLPASPVAAEMSDGLSEAELAQVAGGDDACVYDLYRKAGLKGDVVREYEELAK